MLPSPADLYLLLDSPKQIRANGCTESWLLFSAVQRRALWGSRTNDLSREKFRSCCRLRSVGMRHCLPREGVEESLLPSPPHLTQYSSSWVRLDRALRSSVVWNDLMWWRGGEIRWLQDRLPALSFMVLDSFLPESSVQGEKWSVLTSFLLKVSGSSVISSRLYWKQFCRDPSLF